MYNIHELINQLGARLDEEEQLEAMYLLNNLYLSGYSDVWVCIALSRILTKGSFSQWKYLLNFDDFIRETNYLEKEFMNSTLKNKLDELDRAIAYNGEIKITLEETDYLNENLIFPSWNSDFDFNDYKEEIEYWYMKYVFIDFAPYLLKFEYKSKI